MEPMKPAPPVMRRDLGINLVSSLECAPPFEGATSLHGIAREHERYPGVPNIVEILPSGGKQAVRNPEFAGLGMLVATLVRPLIQDLPYGRISPEEGMCYIIYNCDTFSPRTRMRRLSIREMRAALGRLDKLMEEEGEVLITRHGHPIARHHLGYSNCRFRLLSLYLHPHR